MLDQLPSPLSTPDCDCTNLDGFMLNVERLMASELVALSGHDVVGAALLLWCRAWKQVPAASLPDNDRVNAAFARMSTAKFSKMKDEVLRGFIKCADGRLYHKTLAEEAMRAFERKKAFQRKRDADADRLRNWRRSGYETPGETQDETRFVAEGQGQDRTGQEEKKDSAACAAQPTVPPMGNELTHSKQQKKKQRTSLPDGFPDERLHHWAINFWRGKGRMDLCHSLTDEIEKFRDHATKRDEKYADWTAAWRNWCRNALSFNKGVSRGTDKKSPHQSFASTIVETVRDDLGEGLFSGRGEAGGGADGPGDQDGTGLKAGPARLASRAA